jgi:RHS repeat-associated protein
VVSRTQSEDGTTGTEVTWTYGDVGRGVTTQDGTYSTIGVYPGTWASAMKWGFESAIAGLPAEEDTYTSSGTMLTRHIIERTYDSATVVTGVVATRNPRVTREIGVKFEPGDSNALVSLVTYDYDSNSDPAYFADLNPTVVKYYDYAVVSASTAQTATLATLAGYFSSSSPAKQVETDYLYDANYQARNLTQIPTEVRIKDGSGNVKAKTHFYYDESSYQTTTSGTMPTAASGTWSDPLTELGSTIGSKRALPTTIRSYYDITNGYYIDTHKFYDQYGNVTKIRDGRGNDTTSAFDASYAFTLPTSVTTPVPDSSGTYGSSTAFTSSTAYDYSSGLPTSTTDVNGQTTTVSYADPSTSVLDPLLRPRVITAPNGQQTITEYGDTSGSLYVKVSSQIDSTNWKAGYKYFDNLGRVKRTRSVDAAGDDYTLTCYDNMGRVSKVTNPFRSYSTQTCSTTTGLDWTSASYDAEGRVTEVTTPDTAHVDTAYALASSGSQIGTVVTVTDQASKVRRSVTNALGELIRIDEPTTSGLGTIGSPNQATTYAYDTLQNLTGVTQGSQSRSFSYDALSRLTSATNPESGTIGYGYDNNGNLTSKTDPRTTSGSNWTTTIAYDALNRVITKTYSNDGGVTPPVNYYYDNASLPSGAPSFTRGYSTGRLVGVTYGSGSSNGSYRGYDELGRVVRQYQQTDGVNYLAEATYYLNSAMATETYPSVPGASDRRTVSYSLDSSARLSSLSSSATTYAPAASVSSIGYAPHSALTTETYGNSLIHAVTYNTRLQPNEIKLGTSGSPTSVLDLTYSYGTTTNNGNVQSIGYSGGGLSYTQSFDYDALNRLTTSSESGSAWSQTNAYDRYGNRQIDYGGGSYNLAFSSTANRITTSGYSYDSAGNLTNDTGHAYTFDAENKISKVDTVAAYTYDGEGQRVRKLVGENLRFIYGIGGQEIAEFSGSSGALQKEYIYGASGLLATIEPTAVSSNGTRYTTSDNLGTPRVVTNSSAAVISRHDYKPFGEEIGSGIGGRTTGMGYSADGIRQKFTQKERDIETGLDYFGARYYGSPQGRFTSPDPLLSSGRPEMPESWNRYAYVLNNPLRFIDPDGLYEWGASLGGNAADDKVNEDIRQRRALFRATLAKDQANLASLEKTYGKNSDEYKDAVKAVNAYGTEHDGNKVFVGVVADNKQDTPGHTSAMDSKGNVYVTFQKSFFDKGVASQPGGTPNTTNLEDLAAHEGWHVNEAKSGMRLSTWDSEYNGLSVQSVMATAVNPNGYRYFTLGSGATAKQVIYWNSSWAAADRPTERDKAVRQVLQAPKSDGGYGLSPPPKKR